MLTKAKEVVKKLVVNTTTTLKKVVTPTICPNCNASGLRCNVCGTGVV